MNLVSLYLVLALAVQAARVQPKNGYVPDAATAIKVAEAVLSPIYGEKKIEDERPFTASLKDDVWTVTGTVPCPETKAGESDTAVRPGFKAEKQIGCYGGAAEIRISKEDGRILFVTHYK